MAGRFSVEAVFKAVDRITAPISKMQNRVSKFTRSMRNGLRSANKAVSKLAGGLAKGLTVGAVAAAAALGGVFRKLNDIASEADVVAKQARRLDFGIEELQEWRFVARQSGLTVAEFDKSLEGLSKRMGEARVGTGSLYTFLAKSNRPLLRQLQGTKDVSKAMNVMIKAMADSKDPMERAALASAAFGRQGLKIANIAELGAERIAALRAEQRANGVVTKKQAENAEAYNDAMESLSLTVRGFMQSVLVPLLPMLTQAAKDVRAWALANKDLVSGNILEFGRKVVDNFESIVMWTKRIGTALAVFFTFAAVLKTLVLVMTAVNLVMALNPIGLVVIAVGLLIAALVGLVVFWDEVKAAFLDTDLGALMAKGFEVQVNAMMSFAGMLMQAWTLVGVFFADMWDGITSTFDAALGKIAKVMDAIGGAVDFVVDAQVAAGKGILDLVGLGGDDAAPASIAPQVVSPQARVARSIEEQRTTSTAEVTIRDETGRAEVTQGTLGTGLKLEQTGAF